MTGLTKSSHNRFGLLTLLGVLLLSRLAVAQTPPALDPEVGFDQNLGDALPLDVTLNNEQGEEVKLSEYFGDRPVVLTPVYYKCPMLCGLELNGLVRCLRGLKLSTGMVAGKDFDVVTFSFDPKEPSSLAAKKRKQYLAQYGAEEAESGWHFLTGDQEQIDRLCQAIGFRTKFDPLSGQYTHAAGIVVNTPDGMISRYLYGVEFAPKDLRLAVLESNRGEIGTLADHVLMFCYRYDPTQGKYGLAILNILRAAGTVTVLLLGGFIILMLRRERQARQEMALGGDAHA